MDRFLILISLMKMSIDDIRNQSVYTLDVLALFLIIAYFSSTIYLSLLKSIVVLILYYYVKIEMMGEADWYIFVLLSFHFQTRDFILLLFYSSLSCLCFQYLIIQKKTKTIPFVPFILIGYLLIP